MNLLRLLFLSLVVFVTACSNSDNSEPPAELTTIDNAEYAKVLWSKDAGKGAVNKYVDMQPFINGNKIYAIDTAGLLSQLDLSQSTFDWSLKTGLSAVTGLSGDSSSLVASSRDGEVVLFDYNEKSAEQRWKHQLKSEIRTRAILDGQQVFIRSVDGKLSVLDATTGELQWAVSRRVPALSLTGSSSPIVTDELVISGFDSGKLVAFNRENGSTVWEHTVTSPRGRTEIERLVDLDGQFILLDNIIYISSFQGDLVALTLNSGQVLWSRKFSSFQAMDADNEALYLTDDKSHIWSIDRRTGSAFWKQDVFNARKLTAPRLLGDKIVVADLEGYIHWLSKADGSLLTRIQPFDIRYISQPLAIDSSIVVIDVSGQLTVLTQDKTLESPSYSNIRFNR
ncbi:MAG: outer membrane protein assembly factor BamB [Gammaproteobacteria bacterium]|jgi:outer membrane protein assembly factor BamB|nr:outer membrane protein assembly factor BamB [Gammaproteobacteria bacterium]MBT7047895.1 outer membrane protein assembly factor BamB [Gammaproteobacteria bacterium]